MPPCQGGSRGSESRLPLQKKTNTILCSFSFYARERDRTLHDYKKQNNNEVSNISYFVIKKKVCVQGSGAAAVVLLAWRKDKVCSDMKFIKEVHNVEAIPSPARGKVLYFVLSRL